MPFFSRATAQIEYHGQSGVTAACIQAIVRLVQSGVWVSRALLLSVDNSHAFLLRVGEADHIAVKSGFSSAYSGEGPRGLNAGALTESDLDLIEASSPVRPLRLHDYVYFGNGSDGVPDAGLRAYFPAVVPYRLVDHRIIDLALKFDSDRDAAIMSGYRRLEGIVRERTGAALDWSAVKVFARAFQGDDSILVWNGSDAAESKGKGALFAAVFMAFRNGRAHRELKRTIEQELREFMLLNELYLLEAEAVQR
jgi:hypothetical protein